MSKEWNVSHCWPFCGFSLHLYRCSTQEPNNEPLAGSVQTEQKVLAPVPEPGWCGGRLVKHETTLGWTVLIIAVSDLNMTTFTSDFWNTQKYVFICSFRLDSTCQANLISQALFCFGFVVLCIFFTKKGTFQSNFSGFIQGCCQRISCSNSWRTHSPSFWMQLESWWQKVTIFSHKLFWKKSDS